MDCDSARTEHRYLPLLSRITESEFFNYWKRILKLIYNFSTSFPVRNARDKIGGLSEAILRNLFDKNFKILS